MNYPTGQQEPRHLVQQAYNAVTTSLDSLDNVLQHFTKLGDDTDVEAMRVAMVEIKELLSQVLAL